MKSTQRGASGIFIAVILLLVAAGILAVLALSGGSAGVERGTQVAGRFKVIEAALQQYVTANGSLPCPAKPDNPPALDTGDADPVAASAVCNSAQGTVPWKAIGVRREDTIDAWGGKISYRVFSGNTGLTQANGAGMVNCDTAEPLPSGADASGLCKSTQDTTEAQFLAGKGLRVNAFGAPQVTDVAYVLISHGPTGLGAYTTSGQQKAMPASVAEIANTSAGGPFVAQAASAQGVAPGDLTHFDDSIAYARIGELIQHAGMGGRDWPEPPVPPPPPLSNVTLDRATLTAALGYAPSADTGQDAIRFSGVTARAFDSGGIQTVSFDTTGGIDGIGGAGGGTGISSNGLEGVRLEFDTKARKLGITLNAFGVSGQFAERAELRFFDGVTLVATRIVQACRSGSPDPPASFTYDASLDFDNVEIRSLVTTPNGGGSTQDSNFLLAAVATCSETATTCQSPLDTSANACP